MKTLLLNPPSFEMFDGGASSRYQATREIPSFWYPVWLAYSAGMIPNSRLLDAPSHDVSPEETVKIAGEYEYLVLFTCTAGFKSDVRLAEMIKATNPTAIFQRGSMTGSRAGSSRHRTKRAVSTALGARSSSKDRTDIAPSKP